MSLHKAKIMVIFFKKFSYLNYFIGGGGMNIIVSFDALCIKKTEKYCQKIQRLTGVSNYRLYGFIALLITLVLLDLRIGIIFQAKMIESSIFALMYTRTPFLYWSFVVTGLIDSLFSLYREKVAFEMVKSGCSNPSKVNPFHIFLRINYILIWTAVAVFYCYGIVGSFYDLFLVTALAVCCLIFACDPLPPNDGEIKEWLKSLKNIVSRRLVPQLIKP